MAGICIMQFAIAYFLYGGKSMFAHGRIKAITLMMMMITMMNIKVVARLPWICKIINWKNKRLVMEQKRTMGIYW